MQKVEKHYKDKCKGCDLSQRKTNPKFGNEIIELPGDWILNHYGGDEGFLGWLVLQPKYHKMDISELSDYELKMLGQNIQLVDKALKDYWENTFNKKDTLERIYIVYFFESAFGEHPEEWHLHIHLIPRTKKLGKGKPADIAAWKICTLTNESWFPSEYRLRPKYGYCGHPEKAKDLVKHLKNYISKKLKYST